MTMSARPTRREFAGLAASVLAVRRPNVVFILCDDLGWSELGCYGNRFNETPNLDRLASQGIRFTGAYAAAPVCSPTRASLITGQYPARIGITDFLRADDARYLPPEVASLPKQFAAAGYQTGLIGKWHLMGDYRHRRGDPARHGFRQVVSSESSYIGPGYYFPPYQHMREVKPRTENEYLTDRLNQDALEFISANARQPFFLCLHHYAVHTRLVGKPDIVRRYEAKPGAGPKRNNPALAAMLESIDQGVGAILARLDELGLARDTILVFSSDNGGDLNVTSNAPLRSGKSHLYEGGIRVPLIVRWPAAAGTGVCAEPVSSVDFYPTLLEAAGLARPAGHRIDGVSLLPLWRNPRRSLKPRPLFWHYPLAKPHGLGGRSAGAMRAGAYKLIEFYDDASVELYDLRRDGGETSDLSRELLDKTAAMRRQFEVWRNKTVRAVA